MKQGKSFFCCGKQDNRGNASGGNSGDNGTRGIYCRDSGSFFNQGNAGSDSATSPDNIRTGTDDCAQTTQAQAANAEASYKVYVVGEGETLYGICFKEYHNIRKLQEICQINSLTDENSIYAGQKLLLP